LKIVDKNKFPSVVNMPMHSAVGYGDARDVTASTRKYFVKFD